MSVANLIVISLPRHLDWNVHQGPVTLITELQKFGQVKIEPKKTSIHLVNRFGFAGVYTRKAYINLEVHLNRKLVSKRVSKVEQASSNRYHHKQNKLSTLKRILFIKVKEEEHSFKQ